MSGGVVIQGHFPIPEERRDQLQQLATELNREQLMWLSGYFAGAAAAAPSSIPGFQNNLVRPFTTRRDWDQYIGRVDYQISSRDSLFVRFSNQPRNGISAASTAQVVADFQRGVSVKNFGV